jgi:hypothetical protein
MRPSLRSVRTRAPRPAGHLSFWHDSLEPGDELRPRPALPADVDVDVAVVGAGFTGLWTAYYLARADPHLRVKVIEREVAGFGASGRNGGWCVGDQAAPLHALERAWPGAAAAMVEEMHRSVDEVGAVAAIEGIDCGFPRAAPSIWRPTRSSSAGFASSRPSTSGSGSTTPINCCRRARPPTS